MERVLYFVILPYKLSHLPNLPSNPQSLKLASVPHMMETIHSDSLISSYK